MVAYKTYAKTDASGRLVLEDLPFQQGSLLEVLILDPAQSAREQQKSWKDMMRHVQSLPQSQTMTDEEIAHEISQYRETL